jgi:hypothetical protein
MLIIFAGDVLPNRRGNRDWMSSSEGELQNVPVSFIVNNMLPSRHEAFTYVAMVRACERTAVVAWNEACPSNDVVSTS